MTEQARWIYYLLMRNRLDLYIIRSIPLKVTGVNERIGALSERFILNLILENPD